MRMTGFITIAIAGMACTLVSSTAAHAAIVPIHDSLELFHPVGASGFAGTTVTCAFGCTSFDVGDTSETFIWKILEQGVWDTTAGTTTISYTIGNVGLGGGLTSFHIPDYGFVPIAHSSHTDWSYTQAGGFFNWSTGGAGLAEGAPTIDDFTVTFAGLHSITFDTPTGVDVDHGADVFHDEWIVSTIPLPGAWLLGALGLGMVGWVKRRFA